MDAKNVMRENLTSQSRAYGYTLSVWGSGALLIHAFDTSMTLILAFVLGGVLGFGILALLAFKDLIKRINRDKETNYIAASFIHILASLGTVVVSYLVISNFNSYLNTTSVFLIVGVNASLSYNIMLLVEQVISEDIYKLEKEIRDG